MTDICGTCQWVRALLNRSSFSDTVNCQTWSLFKTHQRDFTPLRFHNILEGRKALLIQADAVSQYSIFGLAKKCIDQNMLILPSLCQIV